MTPDVSLIPTPVRFRDLVDAAGLLFQVPQWTILRGTRGSGHARWAVVWTMRIARDAPIAAIADAFDLFDAGAAQKLVSRATLLRATDLRFRRRTDMMFAAFVKTPKRG